MHIISVQTPNVWDIIKKESAYFADVSKSRLKIPYKEDTEQLGGYTPIWGFAYPDMSHLHMYNGLVLEKLRCELRFDQKNTFDGYILLELDIQDDLVHNGICSNASPYVKVFPFITKDDVRGVYTIRDSDTDGWYHKVLTPIYLAKGKETIVVEETDTSYLSSIDKTFTDCFDTGKFGKCLYCGKGTKYNYKNKHYCSLRCMFKHKERIIKRSIINGNPWDEIKKWETMRDSDFNIDEGRPINAFMNAVSKM